MDKQLDVDKTEEELESLIEKENELNSIIFSRDLEDNNSLDIIRPVQTKGTIENIVNAGEDIGLEISYKNTQFCIKLEIPKSKNINKDEYIIFDLLKYYNIPDNKFLNLEGQEVYIIESKDNIENDVKNYKLSLPKSINSKSKKIFSYIQSAREKGLLQLYESKNKTKIKIEPITIFPILSFTFVIFCLSSLLSHYAIDIIHLDIINSFITIFNGLSFAIAFVSAFYFIVFSFFFVLAIVDKLYEKYIINTIKKYWPF